MTLLLAEKKYKAMIRNLTICVDYAQVQNDLFGAGKYGGIKLLENLPRAIAEDASVTQGNTYIDAKIT